MTGIIVTTPPTVELPPGSTSSNPATLPPVTYRYALLNIPQTWTAKQTFPLGMITLNAADITGTLPATDLPPPTTITLGGVFSKANIANQWINSIGTDGTPTSTQPAFTNISGLVAAAQLPNPTATTLGGVESIAPVIHNWINSISTSGVPSLSQPAASDISGLAASATTDTTNASNITSGTLPYARLPFIQPTSYPSSITFGHSIPFTDSDVQFGNAYSQYPVGIVSTNPIIIGKSGSSIGSTTVGQTFKIVFTSTGLTGSPITITYTAGAAETTTTIAAGLAALVNANTTLHGLGGKPIFMQSLGAGLFNLQYDAAFSATGATPLTTATTGSTGTITLASETNALDYVLMQLGRNATARPGVAGDGLFALDFPGQDSTGTYNTHYGQITVSIANPAAGATRGQMTFLTAGGAEYHLNKGMAFYDASGIIATGGPQGLGTINIPTTGTYNIGGSVLANNTTVFSSIFRSISGAVQLSAAGNIGVNVASSGNIGLNTASPQTQFHVHVTTDQNSFWVDGATAANPSNLGIGIWSLKDDVATWVPISFKASQFIFNTPSSGVSIGTTTTAPAGGLLANASIKSQGATDGIGYATGAGGTVTQLTSRATGVTINKASGAITLFSAAGVNTAATAITFTVTNSAVAATDTVIVSQKSGADKWLFFVTAIAAGSFNITGFTTAGTTTEQPVINFNVIKGVAA